MQSCDVRSATHVKVKDGTIQRIVSKWGIDEEGHLARNRDGGFGVVTEDGLRVSMWEAYGYFHVVEATTEFVWPLVLTRSQHMALTSFLSDYIRQPEALEMSVDMTTDIETTPAELLALVIAINPTKRITEVTK